MVLLNMAAKKNGLLVQARFNEKSIASHMKKSVEGYIHCMCSSFESLYTVSSLEMDMQ